MSAAAQALQLPVFRNILYATDLAEDSRAAIPYVRVLAEEYGSTVHVLHVLEPEPMLEIPLDIPPELDSDRRIALLKLKELVKPKPFGEAKTARFVERGRIAEVLKRFVAQHAIDLIVVGTHGRRGFSKMMLGSVAEEIFRSNSCPVLTVGPHCLENREVEVKIGTVVVATDFSQCAQTTLDYALSLAAANKARLVLVHAVSRRIQVVPSATEITGQSVDIYDEIEADDLASARDEMSRLICSPTMRGYMPETIIELGMPAEVIMSAALKRRADVIVMGAHHMFGGAVASHLPWAIASEVVRSAHCPVLTVHS